MHTVGIWFRARVTGGSLQAGDDLAEVRYFALDQLPKPLAFPTDRLVLETDCPYLAPVPHRGKRNEPAYVYDIASSIAERAETTVDAIAGETTRNAERLFKLEA